MNHDYEYETDDASGPGWELKLGDSCERLTEIPDESIDLSICSPPFAQLYAYSPTPRDLSNTRDRAEFFAHYRFIIDHQLRVTKPGRLAAIHVQQITLQKVMHGHMGLTDFRGEVIRAFEDAGWIFHGEATIHKDPQAQAIRTKAHSLLFVTLERDSTGLRPALADYLLLFKKPGENAVPVKPDVTKEEWIKWAAPIWLDYGADDTTELQEGFYAPGWLDIRETDTLNTRAAKSEADERHIAPLQLEFIRRCVKLYSNHGERVLSPFAGIGSEGYVSVREGRQFVGCELKRSYWQQGVANLRKAVTEASAGSLFDLGEMDQAVAASL